MSGYYIGIHVKGGGPDAIGQALIALFAELGFALLGETAAALAVDDEDTLPEDTDWYGVVLSGGTAGGWTSVYVDDWKDSGVLARGLSRELQAPTLEVWVAEDTHWGYTYYENGTVLDRFADDPSKVAETPAEAEGLTGHAETLAAILQVPPGAFDQGLREAQANAGEFVGPGIDTMSNAVSLPFEHILLGYESLFEDDPDDYGPTLEDWPQWRHLAFRHPTGREQLTD